MPNLFLTDNEVKFLGIILPKRDHDFTPTERIELKSINLKVDKLLLKKGDELRRARNEEN